MSDTIPTLKKRSLATIAASIAMLGLQVSSPSAHANCATEVSVSTEAELRTALLCGTGGAITLTNDIVVNGSELTYSGTSSLTIDGANHVLSAASGATWRILNYIGGAPLTVKNITMTGGNAATSYGAGGAIYSPYAGVTVEKSTFTGNQGFNGGAITASGDITVSDSIFSGNSGAYGAAIFEGEGQISITRSSVNNNNSASGAAIQNNNGDVTIINSKVDGNTSKGTVAGISGDNVTLNGSTVSNNICEGADGDTCLAGGIFVTTGVATINNSTITGNQINGDAFIYAVGGVISADAIHVNFSTLTGNGGDTASNILAAGEVSLKGSVISAPQEASPNCVSLSPGAITSSYSVEAGASYSCVTDISEGTGNQQSTVAAIALGGLADNGGPTKTMLPSPSSVLNTGAAPTSLNTGITTDQRGVSRRAGAFTIGSVQVAAAPTISSLSPTSGPTTGGTSITISGLDIVDGATVTVGGKECTSPAFNAQNKTLSCTTPANPAGDADVVVTNPDAQKSAKSTFTYELIPAVTSLSPTTGSIKGGTMVKISGTSFDSAPTVQIGGVTCANLFAASETEITCTTGASSAGTVDVVVTNSNTKTGTLTNGFTYVDPNVTLNGLLATIINGNSKLTNGQKTSIVNLANKIMLGDCSPITVKSFNDQVNNMVKKGDITKDQGESLKNAVKAICGL